MRVSAEALFTGDWVFEKENFERVQRQSHVGAEEDKQPNAGEILSKIGDGGGDFDMLPSRFVNSGKEPDGGLWCVHS